MNEIREMYSKVIDKDFFKEKLSEVLFITKGTITNNFKTNGTFKKEHLKEVRARLKMQLELDERKRNIDVIGWQKV